MLRGLREARPKWLHSAEEDEQGHAAHVEALAKSDVDVVAFEKAKIKGAIRTDFILSAEIIAITLGTVAESSFGVQVAVLVGIAAIMTAGVYGLVAGIVKLDDLGLYLSRKTSQAAQSIGRAILRAAPYMMKGLSVIGTAAMFLVGGASSPTAFLLPMNRSTTWPKRRAPQAGWCRPWSTAWSASLPVRWCWPWSAWPRSCSARADSAQKTPRQLWLAGRFRFQGAHGRSDRSPGFSPEPGYRE